MGKLLLLMPFQWRKMSGRRRWEFFLPTNDSIPISRVVNSVLRFGLEAGEGRVCDGVKTQ